MDRYNNSPYALGRVGIVGGETWHKVWQTSILGKSIILGKSKINPYIRIRLRVYSTGKRFKDSNENTVDQEYL